MKTKQCKKCGGIMNEFPPYKIFMCEDCGYEEPIKEFADSLKIYNEFPTKLQK